MNRALILCNGGPLSGVYLDYVQWDLSRAGDRSERVKFEGVAWQPAQWQLNAQAPFDLPPGNYRVPVNATMDAAKDGKFVLRVGVPLSTVFDPRVRIPSALELDRFAGFNSPEARSATRAALDQAIADLAEAGIDVLTPAVPKETAAMSQNATDSRRPIYRAQPKLRVIRPRLFRQSPAVTGDHRYEAVGKFWMVVANNMDHASAIDPQALLSVQRPPQVVQGTREHAEDVAAKLARDNPGTEFHVLESVAKVRVQQQHVEQPVGYLEQL